MVAAKHGRNAVLIELNPAYTAMAEKRIADAQLDPALEKMLR
jgi:DNA modification methylase